MQKKIVIYISFLIFTVITSSWCSTTAKIAEPYMVDAGSGPKYQIEISPEDIAVFPQAITKIERIAFGVNSKGVNRSNFGKAYVDKLTAVCMSYGIEVLEREVLNQILHQQQLQVSDLFDPEKRVKIGMMVAVTHFGMLEYDPQGAVRLTIIGMEEATYLVKISIKRSHALKEGPSVLASTLERELKKALPAPAKPWEGTYAEEFMPDDGSNNNTTSQAANRHIGSAEGLQLRTRAKRLMLFGSILGSIGAFGISYPIFWGAMPENNKSIRNKTSIGFASVTAGINFISFALAATIVKGKSDKLLHVDFDDESNFASRNSGTNESGNNRFAKFSLSPLLQKQRYGMLFRIGF